MFNPLNYVKKLKAAGITDAQAQAHAQTLMEVVETLASKEDLKRSEERLDNKIVALDNRITHVEMALTAKINAVDSKINYLIGLVSVIGVVLAGLNIFLNYITKLH